MVTGWSSNLLDVILVLSDVFSINILWRNFLKFSDFTVVLTLLCVKLINVQKNTNKELPHFLKTFKNDSNLNFKYILLQLLQRARSPGDLIGSPVSINFGY